VTERAVACHDRLTPAQLADLEWQMLGLRGRRGGREADAQAA
jgi:hypothetical protein